MTWIAELNGYDPVSASEKTVRFAMGEGVAFSDTDYALGALTRWSATSQRVEFGDKGMVELRGDQGEIVLANFPDSIMEAAPLDTMATWIWKGREAALYWVPGKSWAARTKVTFGILEQPVANVSTSGSMSSVLRFIIRDPRAALQTPLQPVQYAGTNVGPAGVEGGADLKGKPKPIVYGLVSNISPPLVNESLLIYQIADKSIASVLCVRDGGAPLALGVVRGSLVSMQTNNPAAGKYDVYKGTEGTFIRLGSTPIFNLTCDADEATSEIQQSHANIWARIRSERMGSTLDFGSLTAADAVDSAGAGFYWADEISQEDALAEVLGSFSGYEIQDVTGTWSIAKLVTPSGSPTIELIQLQANSRMKAISRKLTDITFVRPRYAQDGSPPFRINVDWGRNYTILDAQALAGAVASRLKEKFAVEYRSTSVSNPTTWDPVAKTGLWKNAPELTVKTAYQPGNDGVTSPGAEAEATRLMALLGTLRNQFDVRYVFQVGDQIAPGSVVRMIHPRMGLAGGALFRILESTLTVEGQVATAQLVIGLQT